MRFKAEIDGIDKTGMTKAVIDALNANGCEASAMGHPAHNATTISAAPRNEGAENAFQVLMSFQGQTMKSAILKDGESILMDPGATEWRSREGEITPEIKARLMDVDLSNAGSRQTYLDAVATFASNLTTDETLEQDSAPSP